VQVLQLVLNRCLGLAADLAPDPPCGAVVAGRDLAAPPPVAVAVPGRVGAAITLMVELNGVLAVPQHGAHHSLGANVEPAAGYGRQLAATRRDKYAAQLRAWPALMQVARLRHCHGKEKVYGSIP
jgi:hypothetical protein